MRPVSSYERYTLSLREYLRLLFRALLITGLFTFVFYRNLLFFLFLLPLAFLFPFTQRKALAAARRRKLLLAFREALSLLASSLSAGYSLENALRESLGELSVLYGNTSLIVREFSYLLRQIGMNIPPEQAVDDFAKRSGLDDIKTFARVLRIARKSGGDLAGILRRTSEVIGDRIQIKEEILTLTAARRFEQRVMNLVPLFMILYVDFSSPGFFRVMYETLLGRLVMTLCLATYLFALYLSQRTKDFLAYLQAEDSRQATAPELSLPREYQGHALRYREKKHREARLFLLLGAVAALLFLLKERQDRADAAALRQRQLLLDYPELVSKLLVLLGAGMNARNALLSIAADYSAEQQKKAAPRAAYEELKRALLLLRAGESESRMYRAFGRACGLRQYMKLASLLEQNQRTGVAALRTILAAEMTLAWEERKNLARRLGEEAGTRLLLPLFLMLLVVMIVMVVPAFFSFS